MNRTDALVAAIGAGVLVVALAGAALTSTEAGGTAFSVTWSEKSASHDLSTGSTAGSGEVEFTWDNPHANTTVLHFEVAVSVGPPHAVSQADELRVTVVGPDGMEYEATGSLMAVGGGSATVAVPVTVNAMPEGPATARGGTPDAAAETLAATYTNETGAGLWTIHVAVSHGSPTPESHTIAASVEAHWYEAEVAPVVPLSR